MKFHNQKVHMLNLSNRIKKNKKKWTVSDVAVLIVGAVIYEQSHLLATWLRKIGMLISEDKELYQS
jgi:hypothetical protein